MRMWKKTLALALSLAMLMSLCAVQVAAAGETAYSGGNGAESEPYLIGTASDLQALAAAVNAGTPYAGKYFQLTADIDLGGAEFTPIGIGHFVGSTHTDVDRPFSGIFDGAGHTISNFKVSQTDAEQTANEKAGHEKTAGASDYNHNLAVDNHSKGLFGYVEGGTVKDLTVSNATITGWNAEAAVIGTMKNGTVSQVTVDSSRISGAYENAGALIGRASGDTTVTACMASGCTVSLLTDHEYENGAGALIGRTQGGTQNISGNIVSECTVSAYRKAAGLIGYILQPTKVTISNNAVSAGVTINENAKNKLNTPYYGILYAEVQSADPAIRCYETYGADVYGKAWYGKPTTDPVTIGTTTGVFKSPTATAAALNAEMSQIAVIVSANGTGNPVLCVSIAAAMKAMDAFHANQYTIVLLNDVKEDVVIPVDKEVTLDLNGRVLTGVNVYTGTSGENLNGYTALCNRGTLTIEDDSPAKTGRVSAAGENASALYNDVGATATLNGGTFTTNEATGALTTSQQGNWYLIRNHGTMTMNSGVKVTAGGNYQLSGNTMITNGREQFESGAAELTNNAIMTINGGTYEGAIFVVKNGDWKGEMTINDGTFSIKDKTAGGVLHRGAVISNSNNCTMTINGGTFTGADNGQDPVVKAKTKSATNEGSGLTIKGGTFIGTSDVLQTMNKASGASPAAVIKVVDGRFQGTINQYTEADPALGSSYVVNAAGLAVSGGCFTSDPTAYVQSGYIAQPAGISGYVYTVAQKTNPAVKVAPAAPEVAAPVTTGKAPAEVTAMQAVAAVLQSGSDVPAVEVKNLDSAAGTAAQQTAVTEAQARTALGSKATADDSVTVYVQPYLDIAVTGAAATQTDGGAVTITELTLSIKPMVKTVASTAGTANGITDGNSEQIGGPRPLAVTTPVTIRIPLPAGFQQAGTMQIKHVKADGTTYYYTAIVAAEPLSTQSVATPPIYYATFTVTHGFSDFTLMAADTRRLEIRYDAASNEGTTSATSATYAITDVGTGLATAARPGYLFTGWTFKDVAGATGAYTTLTNDLWNALMPQSVTEKRTVTAAAQFTPIPAATATAYTLTFNANGGSAVEAVVKTAGTTVDLAEYKSTRDGFTFAGWFTDAALTKAAASVQLSADTTVYAKWTAVNPFTDVADNSPYHDAILWAVGKKVTAGKTATTFAPDEQCTRAQAVTFLWRAMGSPEPTGTANPFTDVSANAYYYKAVLWAVEKKITDGMTATTFAPDAAVTRAQAVTFLWRAAGRPEPTGTVNPFADVSTNAYCYKAVLWAVENKITNGSTTTTFAPADLCLRGQIVTFLYRYLGK